MSQKLKKYRVNAIVSFKSSYKSHKAHPAPSQPPPSHPKSPKTSVSKRPSPSSEAVASTVVETLVDRGRARGGRDRRLDGKTSANRADRFQVRLNTLESEVTNLKRVQENLERRLHVFVKQTHGLTSTTDDYHNRLESLARSCKALSNGK